ncbi:MAG: sugar-binding protein [Candidatus Hinthialibacter antarcticus]|nr:sugar-binding protein [Candidatus Hinthialibacter antarcticus]
MKKLNGFMIALLITASAAFAAEDQRVDINNFETDIDVTITGGTIIYSLVDDSEFDDVPRHEGVNALFGEYDTSLGAWTTTTINFPTAVDMTGMRELHFWIYFLEDSTPHQSGNFTMRVMTQDGSELGSPSVATAGEWHHVVLPIDRVSAESFSAFNQLRFVWNPGADNGATGKFYIDDIYGVRPGNTPGVREELVYGFNQADSATGYPQGWTIRAVDAVDLMMGDAIVDPSEGSDYMESIMPGNWKRPVESINSAPDFDQWDKVVDVSVDVRMSADFAGTWHNFQFVLESSSGGYVAYGIRGVTNKDDWRTLAWDVNMSPHLAALNDPNGWIRLSFITQMDASPSGSVYIDNLRFGLATTFVLGERAISSSSFQGGESFDVNLTVTAEGDAQDYEIIENTPAGWTVSDISDGGTFVGGAINWSVNLANGSKTFSYKITAPQSANQSVAFSGTVGGIATRGDDSIFFISPALWDSRVECPFTSNDIVLDGLIGSDEYAGAMSYNFNHDTADGNVAPGVHISGNEYSADEQNVTFYLLHDNDAIYVACDITDSNLAFFENETDAWQNDSIEVFLDGNLSRSTPRDTPFGIQCTVTGDGHLPGGDSAPAAVEGDGFFNSSNGSLWNYGARVRDDGTGYVVEYQLNKEAVMAPSDRDIVGFEILMNDSEVGGGARTGKWGFHSTNEAGTVFEAYNDEAGWALMQLLPNDSPVAEWGLY